MAFKRSKQGSLIITTLGFCHVWVWLSFCTMFCVVGFMGLVRRARYGMMREKGLEEIVDHLGDPKEEEQEQEQEGRRFW